MNDKPLCPYCGAHNGHPEGVEMIPLMDGWEGVTLITNHYHMCPVCKTSSPKHKNAETALRLALRRFQPMQKPLTLEEVKAYCEKQISRHLYVEFHPHKKNKWINETCDPWRSPRSINIIVRDGALYNIEFRVWWEAPTEDESAAAKWEEEAHDI